MQNKHYSSKNQECYQNMKTNCVFSPEAQDSAIVGLCIQAQSLPMTQVFSTLSDFFNFVRLGNTFKQLFKLFVSSMKLLVFSNNSVALMTTMVISKRTSGGYFQVLRNLNKSKHKFILTIYK